MSPLETELTDLMLDEVTIEHATGKDRYNNFFYEAPVTVRCQIVRQSRRVLDRGGRETISTAQLILANPLLVVSEDDRVTIPGIVGNPAILSIQAAKDDTGPYYLELRL
jgi:hypothetical protein